MNFLVLHNRRGRVGISIEPAGKTYDHPIRCWAIRTGKQVEFTNFRMHKALQPYHFAGSYQTFAHYAMDYDELGAYLEHHMGPDDEQRYDELVDVQRARIEAENSINLELRQFRRDKHRAIAWKAFCLFGKILKHALKCVAILLVVPALIMWMSKKGKH